MICLREIYEEELELIMSWRTREDITKFMYTDPVLTIEKQRAWYEKNKFDNANIHLIIESDNVPIGLLSVTDIDRKNNRCSWGYYIADKDKRNLKLALTIEWNLYDYVFYELKLNKLTGELFKFNKAVIRLHQMCGSVIEGERKEHILKNGKYYDIVEMGICKADWERMRKKYKYDRIEIKRNV